MGRGRAGGEEEDEHTPGFDQRGTAQAMLPEVRAVTAIATAATAGVDVEMEGEDGEGALAPLSKKEQKKARKAEKAARKEAKERGANGLGPAEGSGGLAAPESTDGWIDPQQGDWGDTFMAPDATVQAGERVRQLPGDKPGRGGGGVGWGGG